MDRKKRCAIDADMRFPSDFSGNIIHSKMLTGATDDLIALVFVVAGLQHYVLEDDGSVNITGGLKFKIDQLKLLGFRPILVGIWSISLLIVVVLIENPFTNTFLFSSPIQCFVNNILIHGIHFFFNQISDLTLWLEIENTRTAQENRDR